MILVYIVVGDKESMCLGWLFDMRVDKYTEIPYSMTIEKAFIRAIEECREEYGILCIEIE